MSSQLGRVLLSSSIPVLTATAGAVVSVVRAPGPKAQSAVQHFAGGLVFAVAATELVPDLARDHSAVGVTLGFAAGIAAMLAIAYLPRRLGGDADSPLGTLFGVAVDVVLDGLLIGISFAQGGKAGFLLTVALTIELAFLGLSVAGALERTGQAKARVVGVTMAIAMLIVVGGVIGVTVADRLHGASLSAVLAFGTVALLYLVTEELLAEAHEAPDAPALTAMFFVGFLVILLFSFAA